MAWSELFIQRKSTAVALRRLYGTMQTKRQKPTLQVEADEGRAEWKAHMSCAIEKVTLWTQLHMRVALHPLPPRRSRQPAQHANKDRREKTLNVLTFRYIFDHMRPEKLWNWLRGAQRKERRFPGDFIWVSWLSSIHLILVAHRACRMVFPHGLECYSVCIALIPGPYPSRMQGGDRPDGRDCRVSDFLLIKNLKRHLQVLWKSSGHNATITFAAWFSA